MFDLVNFKVYENFDKVCKDFVVVCSSVIVVSVMVDGFVSSINWFELFVGV